MVCAIRDSRCYRGAPLLSVTIQVHKDFSLLNRTLISMLVPVNSNLGMTILDTFLLGCYKQMRKYLGSELEKTTMTFVLASVSSGGGVSAGLEGAGRYADEERCPVCGHSGRSHEGVWGCHSLGGIWALFLFTLAVIMMPVIVIHFKKCCRF